jgi:hypothetical protein
MSSCRRLTLAIILMLVAVPRAAAATPEEIKAWLRDADAIRQPYPQAVVSVRQTERRAGEVKGVDLFDLYLKGTDRALLVFTGGKQTDRKILIVGEKMWLILPTTVNPVPISPHQRIMGAAALSEVARFRAADDYDASVRPQEEEQGGQSCRVVDLAARSPKSRYSRVELWIDRRNRPRKARFYLASGREAQEVLFSRFEEKGGKALLAEMECHDLLAPGAGLTLTLEYLKYRPARIDDALFTLAGAR